MNILKLLGANIASASGQTIAFRASSSSTASTIVAPTGIIAGDLIVSYDSAGGSTIPTSVIPTGFDSPAIVNQTFTTGTQRRVVISAKIANGTEAGVTYTGMNGNTVNAKIMLVFSTNGATSYNTFSIGYEMTDGNPVARVITSGLGSPPLVSFGYIRNTTTGQNSFTPTETGVVTIPSHYAYYKIDNATPLGITVDTGDGGNANMVATFYIEVN